LHLIASFTAIASLWQGWMKNDMKNRIQPGMDITGEEKKQLD
jgi:hypothetical protein